MSSERAKAGGYLPNDMPPPAELVLLGLQHVVTMFPATVLVALLRGEKSEPPGRLAERQEVLRGE